MALDFSRLGAETGVVGVFARRAKFFAPLFGFAFEAVPPETIQIACRGRRHDQRQREPGVKPATTRLKTSEHGGKT